jgi:hypothetical protein
VAAYIGDSVETVVKVYAHFIDDALRTAKAALDQALATVAPPAAVGEL